MASREKINEVVVKPLQELAKQMFGPCCTCVPDSQDPMCPEHASIAPEWTL